MTEAYIYDAVRTPRGKGRKDGSLHEVTSARLSAGVLNALKERNGLEGHAVEDVIWGNVTQVGEQGGCLARTAVLASDLDESVPGAAIAVDPSIAMETYFVPQGISADIIATEYGFSRDDADMLAAESQRRAAAAWEDKRFDKSIVTVRDLNGLPILDHDEYMRPGTDMQALGALNPAFAMMGEHMPGFDKVALMKYPHLEKINHIHHAGNSSGIVDGAAGLLIGSKEYGEAMGIKPRAVIKATAKIGTDPTIMLTGPVPVTEKILADSGMDIKDIDLFEVNEAFASVVLRFMQRFDVDSSKVNVNGGSIAMGHPLGATGAIIIGTLLDELERTGQGTGLATLCIASGMGAATIIERV